MYKAILECSGNSCFANILSVIRLNEKERVFVPLNLPKGWAAGKLTTSLSPYYQLFCTRCLPKDFYKSYNHIIEGNNDTPIKDSATERYSQIEID